MMMTVNKLTMTLISLRIVFTQTEVLAMKRHLTNFISYEVNEIEIIESQTKEIKKTNRAIMLLAKAMLFYIKHHSNTDKQTVNCAISFLNSQNAKTDNEISKIDLLTNDIKKRVN